MEWSRSIIDVPWIPFQSRSINDFKLQGLFMTVILNSEV